MKVIFLGQKGVLVCRAVNIGKKVALSDNFVELSLEILNQHHFSSNFLKADFFCLREDRLVLDRLHMAILLLHTFNKGYTFFSTVHVRINLH